MRRKVDELFPEEITDKQLKQAFFAPFNGLKGFCKSVEHSFDSVCETTNVKELREILGLEEN